MSWQWWKPRSKPGPASPARPSARSQEPVLEFALTGRDAPPAALVALLFEAELDRLTRLRTLWRENSGLVEPILKLSEADLVASVRRLPTSFFGTDHQWGEYMERLGAAGPVPARLWRAALSQYLAFLGSCLEVVELVMKTRYVGSRPEFVHDATMKVPEPAEAPTRIPAERLNPGEPREVILNSRRPIKLRLGEFLFTLQAGSPPTLFDDAGLDYPLTGPVCHVGRHSDCEIHLGDRFRSLSRRHLLIELLPDQRVRLTDTSTYGSWLLEPQEGLVEVQPWQQAPLAGIRQLRK